MDANERLISQFYSSFQNRDYAGMIACYHSAIHFSDPVFPDLKGKQAGAMWHMLCESGKDLSLTFSEVRAEAQRGQAHWQATYTFSATGRKVHNILQADFEFRDGKISRHRDVFNFWRWSRQALGPVGLLLGWSPLLRNKVRHTAAHNLRNFIERHPDYQ